MMPETGPPPITLPAGDGVELQFLWTGDRYAHQLIGPAGVLIRSAASSPPIQDMHRQRIDDAETALGVGAGDGYHFSVSVAVLESDSETRISFAWACRRKAKRSWPTGFPVCDYDVVADAGRQPWSPVGGESTTCQIDGHSPRMIAHPAAEALTCQWHYAFVLAKPKIFSPPRPS